MTRIVLLKNVDIRKECKVNVRVLSKVKKDTLINMVWTFRVNRQRKYENKI